MSLSSGFVWVIDFCDEVAGNSIRSTAARVKWMAMTTFDEAFPAAARLLAERGLLLNAQLLKAVDGDEALFREVREGLIFDGLAEDRFGVGLARIGAPEVKVSARPSRGDSDPSSVRFAPAPDSTSSNHDSTTDNRRDLEPDENDWWLMAGGVTRGPWKFETLRVMRRRGEIAKMDLVRQGLRGLWRSPIDVDGLKDVSDVVLPKKPPDANPVDSQVWFASPGASVDQRPARSAVADREPITGPGIAPAEPSRHSDDEDVEFYLWELGHPVGPVSRSTLQERLTDGRLNTDDFVQVGQDGEWQPVSKALNVRRASARIPIRSTGSSDSSTNAATGSSPMTLPFGRAHETDSPSQAGAARRSEGGVSSGKLSLSATSRIAGAAKTLPAREASRTAIGRTWQQVSDIVGGPGRLRMILFAITAVVALVVWWRQPPSAGTIYREFLACHQKLKELRERRAGPTDWSAALSRERPRIRLLMDGLKKRASAARPAEQELLWAGQFGLLELLKNPRDATEFERMFADHMSRAQRLIDPQNAQAAESVSNEPVVKGVPSGVKDSPP
jgi:hypothetical protein